MTGRTRPPIGPGWRTVLASKENFSLVHQLLTVPTGALNPQRRTKVPIPSEPLGVAFKVRPRDGARPHPRGHHDQAFGIQCIGALQSHRAHRLFRSTGRRPDEQPRGANDDSKPVRYAHSEYAHSEYARSGYVLAEHTFGRPYFHSCCAAVLRPRKPSRDGGTNADGTSGASRSADHLLCRGRR